MENFRTTFSIPKFQVPITYTTPILLLGSCFSENIGNKLSYYKLPVNINPFGILYNPESVAHSLDTLLKNKQFTLKHLFEHQGVWNSFSHHSRFSDSNSDRCLSKINSAIANASEHLKKTKFILLTFGTSWIYKLNSTNQVVSNCHKLPAKNFSRERLSISGIVARYHTLIQKAKEANPDINIIFTVSPVRHLKDGAVENQISKAILIAAIHELIATHPNTYYFPSYEIMIDDLRDYRFYNTDMIHPSELAINYIWNKFTESAIGSETALHFAEIEKINQAINHRPFNPKTQAHQAFLKNTLSKIHKLVEKRPEMNFKNEIEVLEKQII